VDGFCFRHSDNISQIQVGASAGCGLCGLLFDAFVRKEPEAAQDAGRLPIVLAAGPMIEDDRSDPQLPQYTTLEPRLRSFFVSPEEGLTSLCDLDLSITIVSPFNQNPHYSINIVYKSSCRVTY
jgi:hypothetical protein